MDRARADLGEWFERDGEDREYATAEGYLPRFETLDARLARCPHLTDETRPAWIEAVKGSLALTIAEKQAVADAAANLTEPAYHDRLQALQGELEGWQQDYGEAVVATVRNAVLAGEFFPDCPDAKLAHNQIIGCFGDDPRAIRLGLDLFFRRHRDAWTEKVVRRALDQDPQDAGLWFRLGFLLTEQLGREAEAGGAFRRAAELDPADPYPPANLARLLAAQGRGPEADAAYRQVATLAQAVDAPGAPTPAWPVKGRLGHAHLLLEPHLWLGNRELAQQALDQLAAAAADGDREAFFRLEAQTRECCRIGLGLALQALMNRGAWADFLQPFALALGAAAAADPADALAGAPPELRTLAEEIVAALRLAPDRPQPTVPAAP